MNRIFPALDEAVFQTASRVPTPAVLYDLSALEYVVETIRSDLSDIPGVQLCFSIKANRFPGLLKYTAQLGLGADAASVTEIQLAVQAGFHPIYATYPAYSLDDFLFLQDHNIAPDLNSVSQINAWCASGGTRQVGLRIRPAIPIANATGPSFGPNSRFGVVPDDPDFVQAIDRWNLRVTRVHLHVGELMSPSIVHFLCESVERLVDTFPHVEEVNLGGGLTYLYANPENVQEAWSRVAEFHRSSLRKGRQIKVIVEPGMLIAALIGVLVTEVRAADFDHVRRGRLVVLDASAWNLMGWSQVQYVQPLLGGQPKPDALHFLYGCTCYEQDIFVENVHLPTLDVGDRVLLGPVGAYGTSMARSLHGLENPREYLIKGMR